MKKFTVVNGFSHNGLEYKVGEIFVQNERNLSDYDIQFLLEYRKITVLTFSEKPVEKPTPEVVKEVEEVVEEVKITPEPVKEDVKEEVKKESVKKHYRKLRKSE